MIHAGEVIYALCALTALACTFLLARGYYRSRAHILLWSAACFALLTVNNILLFVDIVLLPGPLNDLQPLRDISGLLALLVLVVGLILDSD